MLSKLAECENKFEEIEHLLTDPEVLADPVRYRQAVTEHAALQETVETYRLYKKAAAERDEARAILDSASGDRELKELAQEQLVASKEELKTLTEKLKMLLSPKDPRDAGDVAVEIRAGAGGEEAALFAAVLFRMYSKYAEGRGWTVSVMDASETELGGFKEIVFTVEGSGAYGRLKYESGVHRVQRVPQTESGGRIHTSTATVAVFPESGDADSFELDMNEVDVDTYRSGGAGGQHINKTESAIRLTHRPTGIVVTCQDQRSQLKNKEKAIKVLKARLADLYYREKQSQEAADRRSQVGTGDRSERIRTYNYPQNRITDHRIDLTMYCLTDFIEGRIDEFVDRLTAADNALKLAGSGALKNTEELD
ncbi:MAG: peptide chain release factor 1 [Clostridia bacterium]|nr:peptide chain release factor 1 [Clostridia bacterium]